MYFQSTSSAIGALLADAKYSTKPGQNHVLGHLKDRLCYLKSAGSKGPSLWPSWPSFVRPFRSQRLLLLLLACRHHPLLRQRLTPYARGSTSLIPRSMPSPIPGACPHFSSIKNFPKKPASSSFWPYDPESDSSWSSSARRLCKYSRARSPYLTLSPYPSRHGI